LTPRPSGFVSEVRFSIHAMFIITHHYRPYTHYDHTTLSQNGSMEVNMPTAEMDMNAEV